MIRKLTERWEVPDPIEAHRVEWFTDSPGVARLLTFFDEES
ncbi:MAG TPA: hypothetical protein VGV38_13830 [Pyrinomonadaceae bacterium]|nr:hypothetical protein [Pyrinomonadaceae bacterium]